MTTINEQMIEEMKNNEVKDLAKYFVSEFQRNSNSSDKTVSDEEALKILKSFKKDIKNNKQCYDEEEYFRMMNFIDKYLPSEPDENDIRKVLDETDFSQLKNKMQAIGIVKKHFNGNVNGELVKNIVENEY